MRLHHHLLPWLGAGLLLATAAVRGATDAAAHLRVARIFGDHMVLQQQKPISVWGEAAAGETIQVTIGEARVEARAAANGHWSVSMPALPAGGPHQLVIRGAETITFTDVLVGEVWFASGQSNMEFALSGATGGAAEAGAADHAGIRFFTVGHAVSRTPRRDLTAGAWQVCTPATAGDFSAVAYFFARRLHADRHVPVGIVAAPYSGTPIEAWLGAEALATLPDFRARLAAIAASGEDWGALKAAADDVFLQREQIIAAATAGFAAGAADPAYDDHTWAEVAYPAEAAAMQLPEHGLVWLRKSVDLPAAAAGRDLTLNLGRSYEWDRTYFNGEEIGAQRWDGTRRYRVPGRLVRPGRNVVAVRLLSEWGMGRLGTRVDEPALTSADDQVRCPLAGPWKFHAHLEPDLPSERYVQREPTALFNGMVAPVQPFPIRGILWYQGEGNADNPARYATLLPLLINDWRRLWQDGELPFLVVQLPNIDAGIGPHWPELREAQAAAARLPHVGVTISLGAGESFNLHPADKRPIGARLYRAARHFAYGEDIAWTGPVFAGASPEAGGLRVHFATPGGGLTTSDAGPVKGFEIRGADGAYEPATAEIAGDSVMVRSARVPQPTAVRYAWAPDPDANLADRDGLPAAPFRSDPPAPIQPRG